MLDLAILIAGAWLLPCLLALLFSGQWRSWRAWLLVLASTGALSANLLALSLAPKVVPALSAGLQWNWFGKVAGIGVTLLVYLLLPAPMRAEAGLFARPRPSRWAPVLLFSGATIAAFWAVVWAIREPTPLDVETLLY